MSQVQKETRKDRPWLFRTYAGHSTAKASNELYRGNLAKGQTGLSVAFDLPTQTGYDSDHELARGEVGKVGVPLCHLGDMRALFDQIPLEQMNTSMTINATAPWLLALYIAVAEEQGADVSKLQGTVQNDLIKEYLSRGTYICPPKASKSLNGIDQEIRQNGKRLCIKEEHAGSCDYQRNNHRRDQQTGDDRPVWHLGSRKTQCRQRSQACRQDS